MEAYLAGFLADAELFRYVRLYTGFDVEMLNADLQYKPRLLSSGSTDEVYRGGASRRRRTMCPHCFVTRDESCV